MKKGGNTYAVINWAEDVQDLMIESVVHLLEHKNPYTGKTYAHDPALAYIELQNEDDIFFWTSSSRLQRLPHLSQATRGAVCGVAQGQVRHAGETRGGLDRCAEERRATRRRQDHRRGESLADDRRRPAQREGRPAPADAGQRRLPPLHAEQVLQQVRQGDSRRRIRRPAGRFALAGARHAAALLQLAVRRPGRLHRPPQLFR